MVRRKSDVKFNKKFYEWAIKKFSLFFFVLLFCLIYVINVYSQAPTSAWINEFHYDNVGTDEGEFVEIIVNQSFTDLVNLRISFYRAVGTVYASRLLSSFDVGDSQDGFTIYSKSISIQNGTNEGFSLDYSGVLLSGQFLSYEGTLTATEGPANGSTSTDIGVSEDASTPVGNSLYLTGNGTQYSDFTWTSGTATVGSVNGSQILPVELTSFSASITDNGIKLNWRTETEVNNYGFDVERSSASPGKIWEKICFVNGNGNSNSPKEYSFIDKDISGGKYYYRLKQIDNDGTFTYSKIINIDSDKPSRYELDQNYPNPFNPVTTIKFTIPQANKVTVKVFNVLGEEVAEIINQWMEAGTHEVNFDASDLNSGIYLYKIKAGNFVTAKKMTLLK